MRRIHRSTAVTVALAGLCFFALQGCSKSSSTLTGSNSSATAATAATGSTAGVAFDATNRALQGGDTLRQGPCDVMGFPVGIPSGCPWDAATSSFVCSSTDDHGVTGTHSYRFLDGSGTAQAAYDSATTASIVFHSHLGAAQGGGHGAMDDTRDLVLSGLAGSETRRTWNGTGASTHQDSVRNADGSRSLVTSTSNTTVGNVVVPRPWARDSWPLSGTITTHLVATGGAKSVDLTSVLTFNGTQYATLTVGDSTVTVDLKRPPHGPPPGMGGPPGGAPPDSGFVGVPPDSGKGGPPGGGLPGGGPPGGGPPGRGKR